VAALGAVFATFDPPVTKVATSWHVMRHMFDPLVWRDAEANIHPWLAKSWSRVDELTWKFDLRKGVKFHNGEEFDAHSAAYTLRRHLDSRSKQRWLYGFLKDCNIKAEDKYTLVIQTKEPMRPLVRILSNCEMLPKEAAKDFSSFGFHPIGTGPFVFKKFVPNDRVIMTANEKYWGGAPNIKKLTFRMIPEKSTRVTALRAGEVHLITNLGPEDMPAIEKDRNLDVVSIPTYRIIFAWMNINKRKPLASLKVRQAINYAINRKEIIEYIIGGKGSPAVAPINPHTYLAHQGLEPYSYDPQKAKKLLKEAGYEEGFKLTIGTPIGRYLKDKEIAEVIGGQLAKVNIQCTIKSYEYATYQQEIMKYENSSLDMGILGWGNLTGGPDYSIRSIYSSESSWNISRYKNEKVDELLDIGVRTFDEEKLKDIYYKIQEIIWQDCPVLFIYNQPDILGISKRLKDFEPRPDEYILLRDCYLK